jgi:hypothetical protein
MKLNTQISNKGQTINREIRFLPESFVPFLRANFPRKLKSQKLKSQQKKHIWCLSKRFFLEIFNILWGIVSSFVPGITTENAPKSF